MIRKEPGMTDDIKNELIDFLTAEVLEDTTQLSPDEPLLQGLLDSFGLLALLNFIEEQYRVVVDHDQVVTSNFSSVSALATFIESKRMEAAAS
jgi:acyl carrier protein